MLGHNRKVGPVPSFTGSHDQYLATLKNTLCMLFLVMLQLHKTSADLLSILMNRLIG